MSYKSVAMVISSAPKSSHAERLSKNASKIRWVVATIVLLAGLIAYSIYETNRKSRAYEKFSNSLEKHSYTDALVHLESFDDVFDDNFSKYNAKDSKHLPNASERKQFIVKLVKILDEIHNENDNYIKVLKKLKSLPLSLQRLTTGSKDRSRFSSGIVFKTRTVIEHYKEYYKLKKTIPLKEQENLSRMSQHSILSQDLANEFGDLLGLAPESFRNNHNTTRFYQEGVLKGLPVLKDLPDGIETLIQLKHKIDELGGKVDRAGGLNTPEIFRARLGELQARARIFENQISNLEEELKNLKDRLASKEKSFKKSLEQLVIFIQDFIIVYVRP